MDSTTRLFRFGVFYAVLFGAVAILYPFIAIYFDLRGFSPSQIGMLLAAMEIAGIVSPLIVSRIADRSSRFRSVIGVLLVLTALSVTIIHRYENFVVVFIAAMTMGFFLRPIIPLSDALSGRVLVDSSRNYGRIRVWGTISFILLSLALQYTGVLGRGGASRLYWAFLIALGLELLAVPVAPGTVESRPIASGRPDGKASPLPRRFFFLLAFCLLGNIGYATYQAFGTLFFSEIFGVSAVSGLVALASISEIPVMLFGGRLLRRIGHRGMFAGAMIAGIIRLIILATTRSEPVLILSQLTHSFSYGCFLIAGVNWINSVIPDDRRALGMGLFMAVGMSGPVLLASSLGGFLLENSGFSLLFASASIFPALGLIFLFLVRLDGGSGIR